MSGAIAGLITVRDRAQQLRDDAELALREAQRVGAQSEEQGAMLKSYRQDTAMLWTRPQHRQTDRTQLATAHQFLDRLDDALQQQQHQLQHAKAQIEQRRQSLLAAETRLSALNRVIEQRLRLARAASDRKEQSAIDQFAQLSFGSGGPRQAPWAADPQESVP